VLVSVRVLLGVVEVKLTNVRNMVVAHDVLKKDVRNLHNLHQINVRNTAVAYDV